MATLAEFLPLEIKRKLFRIGREADKAHAAEEERRELLMQFGGDEALAGTLLDIRHGLDISVPKPPARHARLASSPRVLAQRTANRIG